MDGADVDTIQAKDVHAILVPCIHADMMGRSPLRVQFHWDRMALHPTIGGTLFPHLPIASTLVVGSVALEISLESHPWWPRDGGLPRGRGGPRSRMREIE